MIVTSMNIEQVEALEQVFAYLTDNGWITPRWLIELRKVVEQGLEYGQSWGEEVEVRR